MPNISGIDSDLIRGHIDTIILKALFEGDKYGYEICKEVEEKSGGTYELKQPTLYSCLKRLETQKLISSYWTDSEIGGKRHYYKLTDLGKETYQKNQDDWNRSRVIIDSLISNGEKPTFVINSNSSEEVSSLQKQIEELQKQLEQEKQNKPAEKIVYVPAPQISEEKSTFSEEIEEDDVKNELLINNQDDDQSDFIPWDSDNNETEEIKIEEQDNESSDPENENIANEIDSPIVSADGEQEVKYVQLSDNFIARVAANGEILSVEKAPLKTEDSEETENETEDDNSPAQVSVFDENKQDNELVFDENESKENDENVDIMTLLGHTPAVQIEHSEQKLIDHSDSKEDSIVYTNNQTTSPFEFKIDDIDENVESFFDAKENEKDVVYAVPEEHIVGKEEPKEEHTLNFNFDSFKFNDSENDEKTEDDHTFDDKSDDDNFEHIKQFEEDEKIENVDISAPVYHDFGAVKKNYEEANLTSYDPDEIYHNPDQSEIDQDDNSTKLFFDEDLIDNDDSELSYKPTEEITDETEQNDVEVASENEQTNNETEDYTQNSESQNIKVSFYNPTENYDNLKTNYTDEKYKEKLSALMTYQTKADGSRENFEKLTSPKDFKGLKKDFEEEGIIVKPHTKMVKESKDTRSYVESNKLNIVNSWTAYGIVAFFTLLTFIIMNNYKSSFSSFDFSIKYFLIGLAILMVVPLIYSVIYFINPYKKKPARYASRIYLLFALLLTVQLLIIIYSVNLQLGFYSFHQENYNHLYWIVPTLLSLYPLVDAILHSVYFNSKNFHI